ncbi:hypothetical protein D3C84_630850 [compost metagenome]
MGFERQQTQQVVDRVVKVGAIPGRRAIGNHPQPLQAHDVVDPQAAGVGEIGAEHFDKRAKPVAHQTFRRKRGNAPALAGAVENVRRRTHRQRGEQFVLATPGLAAAAVGTDREVSDQANAHAATARSGLCALQATGNQPLAEGEEADAPGVLFGKFSQRSTARVAPLLGPLAPVEVFTFGGTGLLNGFETAVVLQRFASRVAEAAEVGVQRVFALDKAFVQRLQQTVLGVGRHRPVNQRLLFQMLELGGEPGGVNRRAHRSFAKDRAGCCVQAVEEQAAGRRIRAIALGVAAEHRVQRTDRQRFGATLTGNAGEVFQRLGVAKTAIAGTAQRVQLHAQPPGARDRAVDRIADAVAACRRHGQRKGLAFDTDVLITDRNQAGQHRLGIEFQVEPRSVLKVDLAGGLRLEIMCEVEAHANVRGQQRRQMPGLLHLLQFLQAGIDLLGAAGRMAEPGQDIA